MTRHRAGRMLRVAGSAVLLAGAAAWADQPGMARFPAPSAQVGGVRAAMPGPRIGFARGGTLLDRGGSLLPPSPTRVSSPSRAEMPSYAVPRGADYVNNLVKPIGGSGRGDGGRFSFGENGFTSDGSTTSDRFRLSWHIGSGSRYGYWHHHGRHHGYSRYGLVWRYPVTWWYGGYWYDRPYYSYSYSNVYGGPWYGTDPFVTTGQSSGAYTPSAAAGSGGGSGGATTGQAAQPRELTTIEKADLYWQLGEPGRAVQQFKQYLATAKDDTDAMRYMALALLDDKKIDEAVALMAMAYEKTPQLASRPLPTDDIPGGDTAMRRRVNAVSGYANRTGTGSAWMTLAVLVQAEGRDTIAKTLVERAQKAGLKPAVASELTAALGG